MPEVTLNLTFAIAASAKDIDLAVESARKAFNTTWGKHVPGTQRAALLLKLADLMERDAQVSYLPPQAYLPLTDRTVYHCFGIGYLVFGRVGISG